MTRLLSPTANVAQGRQGEEFRPLVVSIFHIIVGAVHSSFRKYNAMFSLKATKCIAIKLSTHTAVRSISAPWLPYVLGASLH